MGDRVTVRLTLLSIHAGTARTICAEGCGEPDEEDDDGTDATFTFNEVNYGNLGVEKQLLEAGIPYDKHWQQGGEFEEGTEYVRFTDTGEAVTFDVYTTGENPELADLLALLDKPDELRAHIVKFSEAVTPLPWDDQERNAKRYLARQLISE